MEEEIIVALEVTDEASEIMQCHQAGLESMVGSLKHFAQAGSILASVKEKVSDFKAWCKDNVAFSRKTAYQYMKLHDKVQGGLDLESGEFTSIRQCLGIDHDGEKSTYSEKRSDPRFENIPGLCAKIEQSFKSAVRVKPIESWTGDEKRILATSLEPLLEIHTTLS
jgi:hypothetical protein